MKRARERETVMRKGVGQQRFHRDLREGSNDVTVADLNEAFLESSCAFRTCVDVPTPRLSSTLLWQNLQHKSKSQMGCHRLLWFNCFQLVFRSNCLHKKYYKRNIWVQLKKGVAHSKLNICWKCTLSQAIQNVDEFFSMIIFRKDWRNLAFDHLITNESSKVNVCHQKFESADKNITIIHK